MTMIFQFKSVLLRDAALSLLDLRVLELHHFFTFPANQMVMMGLGTPALVISIAARSKTLGDHARLQKHRKIPVDCVPRDLEPLFFKTGNENVHVEMPALELDPFDQLEPLTRQPAPLAADKTLELFSILDHNGISLLRLSLNNWKCSGKTKGCQRDLN